MRCLYLMVSHITVLSNLLCTEDDDSLASIQTLLSQYTTFPHRPFTADRFWVGQVVNKGREDQNCVWYTTIHG